MVWVVLILAIALVNLGLGYALATMLGYGPPGLRQAWRSLGVRLPPPPLDPALGVAKPGQAAK